MSEKLPTLQEALAELRDFRSPQGRRYKLQAVLILACLAMMHGAQSEEAIAEWSEIHGRKWLRLLGITGQRVPSQATIHRIFRGVDKVQLNAALRQWSNQVLATTGATGATGATVAREQAGQINGDSAEGIVTGNDSLKTMNQWVSVVMRHLPRKNESTKKLEGEALDKGLTLSGFENNYEALPLRQDFECQHLSEAGLKIWGLDLESRDSNTNSMQAGAR